MKKRNFLSCLLIIAIVLATISPTVLFAAEDIAQDEQVYDETYTEETEEYVEETPEAYDWTIETNELKKWPQGPRVEAEGATVMDLDTGAFLYSKNAEAKLYPASITKIMTVLLALTRFPARAHRDPVLWLCAHALMEQASVALEQDGTMFIGEEFDLAATWAEHLKPMREISDWWTRVSPLDGAAAHRHRKELQTCIKRRQYAVLGGYVSRALREDQNLSVTCFAFVPLVIEAIWSQHAELSLRTLTEGLNLNEMTRRPRQALLAWLNALQPSLRACPQPGNAKPIEKVIDSIRADCSLPYSQANLSRSLGLTPAYFCRLFHEKTGQHFSTFLTRTRMEKAQMMLSSKEPQTLGEISAACGYPNKSYFCQVFKKYTGMTPGEYQAMAKEK